jgi:hypothetical protein
MPQGLPAGVTAGQIYRHASFYQDPSGKWQTKYLLVLAATPGGDVVFRLLTSRAHGRAEAPPAITAILIQLSILVFRVRR